MSTRECRYEHTSPVKCVSSGARENWNQASPMRDNPSRLRGQLLTTLHEMELENTFLKQKLALTQHKQKMVDQELLHLQGTCRINNESHGSMTMKGVDAVDDELVSLRAQERRLREQLAVYHEDEVAVILKWEPRCTLLTPLDGSGNTG